MVSVVGKKKDPDVTEEQVKAQLQNCIGNSHNTLKQKEKQQQKRTHNEKDSGRKCNLTTKFGKENPPPNKTPNKTPETVAEPTASDLPPEPITPSSEEVSPVFTSTRTSRLASDTSAEPPMPTMADMGSDCESESESSSSISSNEMCGDDL